MKMMSAIGAALAATVLLASSPAFAGYDQNQKVQTATDVLREIDASPPTSIPPALLRNAQGIAVIPSVVKAGFILGGRHGDGVLVVRKDSGQWSDPLFVSLTGGSIGWQAGVSSTDVVLVFKNRRGIDGIMNGKFTLGVDGAVAAGPVGREASASTTAQLNASVYSYSRSRGLFAGVSLDGSQISIDQDADSAFYGGPLTADQILSGVDVKTPKVAKQFIAAIDKAEQQADK
jgi:lipid-binding SYLF domain-containing protein